MNIKNLFRNKTVIVTGHTGFKGSWLVAFKHKGFWQCMDSKRDKDKLEKIIQNK